jgi:hypothetical protein
MRQAKNVGPRMWYDACRRYDRWVMKHEIRLWVQDVVLSEVTQPVIAQVDSVRGQAAERVWEETRTTWSRMNLVTGPAGKVTGQ